MNTGNLIKSWAEQELHFEKAKMRKMAINFT
jgi:hypothetical protein